MDIKKKKGTMPHEVDEQMDILNTMSIEPEEDIVLRHLGKGAVAGPPLSWADMGLIPERENS